MGRELVTDCRYEVLRFGCNSHKIDNTLKHVNASFARVWRDNPDWTPPVALPNKFQRGLLQELTKDGGTVEPSAEGSRDGKQRAAEGSGVGEQGAAEGSGDGEGRAATTGSGDGATAPKPRGKAKMPSGGLHWIALSVFLVASVEPRENGQQRSWQEYAARKDKERGFNMITLIPVGKARYHESMKMGMALLIRRPDLNGFLMQIEAHKGKFGNLEKTVFDGLNDTPTMMEVALMSILYYEVGFPSMALKKVVHNHWDMGVYYDHFERELDELIECDEKLANLLKGKYNGVVVKLEVKMVEVELEKDGVVEVKLELRACASLTPGEVRIPCLFGDKVSREPTGNVDAARFFIDTLKDEHKAQAPVLMRAALVDMQTTFRRFASDQLESQGGVLQGKHRHRYGLNPNLQIQITNDICERLLGMVKQDMRKLPGGRSDTVQANSMWRQNRVAEAIANGDIHNDVSKYAPHASVPLADLVWQCYSQVVYVCI